MKTILLVNRDLQKDSIGYNFVADISNCLSRGLLSGEILAWETPEMKNLISKDSFEKLSKLGVIVKDAANLFIYETWQVSKKTYSAQTQGLSLSGKTKAGKDISFGYINFDESIRKKLADAYCDVNANGFYGSTLLQVLINKAFTFDFAFWGENVIDNISKSNDLHNDVIVGKQNNNAVNWPATKLINYSIESGPSIKTVHSAQILEAIQTFFNNNPQEFYNYGGEKILSYLKQSPIIISKMNITELWTKKGNKIITKPLNITPYVLGVAMDPIPIAQLNTWKININDNTIEKTLLKKDYYYILRMINGTSLTDENAESFRQALLTRNWGHILEQVQTKPTN